jgi:SAM-dependent methyltransferase
LPEKPSDRALVNRAYWDRTSDEYQDRHREFIGRPEPRWGVWQIPEVELQVLGDVEGKDVLELGCGAAQWSILLAKQGARPVGLDNSERQLEHAREARPGRRRLSADPFERRGRAAAQREL